LGHSFQSPYERGYRFGDIGNFGLGQCFWISFLNLIVRAGGGGFGWRVNGKDEFMCHHQSTQRIKVKDVIHQNKNGERLKWSSPKP
jgi:hypothetical protein